MEKGTGDSDSHSGTTFACLGVLTRASFVGHRVSKERCITLAKVSYLVQAGDPYATDLERAGVRNSSPKRMRVRIASAYRGVSHGASPPKTITIIWGSPPTVVTTATTWLLQQGL